MMTRGDRVSFCGDEKVLKCTVVMAAPICEYTKIHRMVHFK